MSKPILDWQDIKRIYPRLAEDIVQTMRFYEYENTEHVEMNIAKRRVTVQHASVRSPELYLRLTLDDIGIPFAVIGMLTQLI